MVVTLLGLNTLILIILILFLAAVTNVAMLMGCNSKDLMVVLSTCKLRAGRDCIAKRLTLRQVCLVAIYHSSVVIFMHLKVVSELLCHIMQATDMRDSLAKIIYASLFNWLVEQINTSLEVGRSRTGRSISILDIYGFESFKVRKHARDFFSFYILKLCND